MNGVRLVIGASVAAVALTLACGRYGAPIRPEARPEPAPSAEEPAPETPEAGEPDFRLDLPGLGSEDEDE